MLAEGFATHLDRPLGRGHTPANAATGAAGGAACGDLIRISLALHSDSDEGRIVDAGFDASGCGAMLAAGSAAVGLLRDAPLLAAARLGAEEIAAELGGLSPAKRHAAELAADAMHRALGFAARQSAQLAPAPARTLVAMSGGVDSAVAALLTAQAGAEVVAVTLELWSDPENDGERSCCSAQAVRGAREVAHGLGVPHLSIDLREEFRAGVVEPWLDDHAAGLTPNPCVRCNGNVRLDAMLALGLRLGTETLATGHYARVHEDGAVGEQAGALGQSVATGRVKPRMGGDDGARTPERLRDPLVRLAADPAKDQSYVLAGLAPESLARLRFPLGELTKPQVRELAQRAGLPVARKPDSQDLCFLAGTGVKRFLARHGEIRGEPGAILDASGRELGRHEGHHAFTVGQRHGLGIGGGTPLYVIATDAASNAVTVGSRAELLTRTVQAREVTLRRGGACVDAVKIRSRGRRIPCRVPGEPARGSHARLEIELLEPLERTAPGQLACLFCGDLVVGHGTIA